MKKKRCQMKHLQRRWSERTGNYISSELHMGLVKKIQEGKSTIYDKQSNRISVHIVTVNKEEHRVVYDKIRKQLVTILPKEIYYA